MINAGKSIASNCMIHAEIVGLFCKRALSKRLYSAKETYDFKELGTYDMTLEYIHYDIE